ncbi:MAG: hypothetical protein HWN67_05165 [Candidatus Helarchaeota archaeon]|nr:hypothetical protein [Candidatus Helarchaeota archaeon]
MFEKLDKIAISRRVEDEINWFMKTSSSDKKGKVGFIDPFQLIENITTNDLRSILQELEVTQFIEIREEVILLLYQTFHKNFEASEEIRTRYSNPIDYLGHILFNNPKLKQYFNRFDVVSLHELVEIFANFSADSGFNVYDLTDDRFPGDLFITMGNKNEVAILLSGHEIVDKYEDLLVHLIEGAKYSDRIVFITTALAILKKKWFKLKQDMKNLGAWVYVVDPFHGVIYGVLKGKKSPTKEKRWERELKSALESPLRVSDSNKKISKYIFDEKNQYKSDNYVVFGKNLYPVKSFELASIQYDRKNLQFLILLENRTGNTLDTLVWGVNPPDPDLISGFIHAIDTFGRSLADSKGLDEIKYQDFIICCVERKYTKAFLFLTDVPSPRLKELLIIGLREWEKVFENELKMFIGKLDPFIERHLDTFHLFNRLFLGTA